MDRVSVLPDTDGLWRVERFATWADISVPTAYYQIAKGRVPGVVRFGKTIRIDPEVAIPALREAGIGMIDLEAVRRWFREHFAEPVEVDDPEVLDAAAAVVVSQSFTRQSETPGASRPGLATPERNTNADEAYPAATTSAT